MQVANSKMSLVNLLNVYSYLTVDVAVERCCFVWHCCLSGMIVSECLCICMHNGHKVAPVVVLQDTVTLFMQEPMYYRLYQRK